MAKGFEIYGFADRNEEKSYPSWRDAAPNLNTFLTALNKSQPIIQCQYEMVWSRWPRTIFFAKSIRIPGLAVHTEELSRAGFSVQIPTHVTYENTEISFTIYADKEGFHYYDMRNMVFQTGHPLVAGDPRAAIGDPYGVSPNEDTIEIRLRNKPEDEIHHHWIIHNFHPTKIGDLELDQSSSSFVEIEVSGTFTHISYDCGEVLQQEQKPAPAEEDVQEQQENTFAQMMKKEEEEQPPESSESELPYSDFRERYEPPEPEPTPPEPQPPEPEPEPKPPSYNILVSANISATTELDENGDGLVTTLSDVSSASFREPVDDEYVNGAKECMKELNDAQAEFNKDLKAINNMPADPNFTPEDVFTGEETFNYVNVPREGQGDPNSIDYDGDSVTAGIISSTTVKSQAQKDAWNAAIAKYNKSAQGSLNKYKESRQKKPEQQDNGSPNGQTPDEGQVGENDGGGEK